MKLIAGLGNPGTAYARTRHNIGFMAVDGLAAEAGISLQAQQYDSLTGSGAWCGSRIMLVKPLTFMNRSGPAIRAIADALALQSRDILVIHDDMDIPFGEIRLKTSGGTGGHRGIASICEQLMNDAFIRLRIGIGRPPNLQAGADYVLDTFSETEHLQLATITDEVVQCVQLVLTHGIAAAMNRFHARQPRSEEKSTSHNND